MGYRLTRAAAQDIGAIAETGIELFGIDQARAYHAALFGVFDLISDNPRMAHERTELTPPLRVHPFRSHIILYKIEDGDVLIVRVRHAHEDWYSAPD